jgi:hypothetical protein
MSETQGGTCPLCEHSFDTRSDLRVHVMCEHRKSDVVDALLAATEGRTEEPVLSG